MAKRGRGWERSWHTLVEGNGVMHTAKGVRPQDGHGFSAIEVKPLFEKREGVRTGPTRVGVHLDLARLVRMVPDALGRAIDAPCGKEKRARRHHFAISLANSRVAICVSVHFDRAQLSGGACAIVELNAEFHGNHASKSP